MAEVFLYADETGNLDYDGEGKSGASTYFGFGTAVFNGDHADALFGGMRLRAEISSSGIYLPEGFHAVNDKIHTKNQVFQLIGDQAPRFDSTFLYKAQAYDSVKRKGQNYLYKMAWFLHLKEVALQVTNRGDTLYVVAGTFGTAARQTAAKMALEDVCRQVNRDIKLCVWKSSSSWGLQVADYGLWAVQRRLEGKSCRWLEPYIQPTLITEFHPWGRRARSDQEV
ncbi:DUF3800 domain-containing protein [Arthrobacter sp. ISL-69]|uniref:DUF3800 domain-containing protein n=1 Tax=Arthrobacter sp. ISL-69 TaxID=2819113 RepID=UPI001BE57AF7|nr:DUF3800 domain-containing protein [Arthrobacter sp. ISL-69]MBT2538680.1 DUF3800 domain-containing protein [Arthrobacter sp. ISL-69]